MSAIPAIAGVAAVAAGLLWGCGFLVAPLLVPRRWWPFLPLLAPFLGFALISAIAHVLGVTGHSLASALWLFPVLAAAGWAVVLLDRRLRRLPRSSLPALGICLAAFLIAVIPLIGLGYLTTVGHTIDAISYACRSEYLQQAPLTPPDLPVGHPWFGWVRAQLELLRAGDVYLTGLLGLLTGRPIYELLTLVSALFFALTAGSTFIWVRGSLGFRRGAALLATALVGISNLLLWAVYDNFLSQTVAISFFPLLLCFGVEGWRSRRFRTAALFGVLAATEASIYPIYGLYALMAVLCFWGAALLLQPRGPRWAGLGPAARWWLTAGAAAVAWNGIALVRAKSELGFIFSALGPTGLQLVSPGNILIYPPAIEMLGLIAHAASAHGSGWQRVPLPVLTGLGLGFAALAVYGWWHLGRHARLAAAALVLTCALLTAQQRWVVNPPDGYPYGWYKAVSALTPLVLALVAAGIAAAWRHRSWRWPVLGAALLLFTVNVKHTAWTAFYTLESLVVLDRELIEAGQAAGRLGPDAWVLIDLVPGVQQHWLGVLLREPKIHYRERLFTSNTETPGWSKATFQYAVVEKSLDGARRSALEEPWYSPERYVRVWGNGRYELRRRRDAVLASLAWGRPWPEGAAMEIAVAPQTGTLEVRTGPEQEAVEMVYGRPRTLQVHLYSAAESSRFAVSGGTPVSLPPGGWVLDLDLECIRGGRIDIDHVAGATVLAEIRVLGAATGRPGVCLERVPLRTGAVYVAPRVLEEGKAIQLDALLVRPEGSPEHPYRLGLHAVDPAQQKMFGFWNLDFPPGGRVQRGSLRLDLRDRSARGELDGRPIRLDTGRFDTAAGSFAGAVVWWQLDPVEQLLVEPMLWFGGSSAGSVQTTRTASPARLVPLPPP